jgi:hypothetical protein
MCGEVSRVCLLVVLYGLERFAAVGRVRGGPPCVRSDISRRAAAMAADGGQSVQRGQYSLHLGRDDWDRSQLVLEWFPLWGYVDSPTTPWLFFFSLVAGAYAILRGGNYRPIGLLFLLVMSCQALLHYRHLSLYAVAWMAVVPAHMENTGLGRLMRRTWEHKHAFLAGIWLCCDLECPAVERFWHLQVTQYSKRCKVAYSERESSDQSFKGNLMVPRTKPVS